MARKIAMMLAPTSENARAAASCSAWPATPPLSRTGSPPAPNSSSAEPIRHSAPARNGRNAGSTGRITSSAPAATSANGAAYATVPAAQVSPSTIAWPASPPSQPR